MKMEDIKGGDEVQIDNGFTCMTEGVKTVSEDGEGLFIECSEGKHYLDGQENEHGDLVGILSLSRRIESGD